LSTQFQSYLYFFACIYHAVHPFELVEVLFFWCSSTTLIFHYVSFELVEVLIFCVNSPRYISIRACISSNFFACIHHAVQLFELVEVLFFGVHPPFYILHHLAFWLVNPNQATIFPCIYHAIFFNSALCFACIFHASYFCVYITLHPHFSSIFGVHLSHELYSCVHTTLHFQFSSIFACTSRYQIISLPMSVNFYTSLQLKSRENIPNRRQC